MYMHVICIESGTILDFYHPDNFPSKLHTLSISYVANN